MLAAMKAARERGDIAYLRYDKVIVHPPLQKQHLQGQVCAQNPDS